MQEVRKCWALGCPVLRGRAPTATLEMGLPCSQRHGTLPYADWQAKAAQRGSERPTWQAWVECRESCLFPEEQGLPSAQLPLPRKDICSHFCSQHLEGRMTTEWVNDWGRYGVDRWDTEDRCCVELCSHHSCGPRSPPLVADFECGTEAATWHSCRNGFIFSSEVFPFVLSSLNKQKMNRNPYVKKTCTVDPWTMHDLGVLTPCTLKNPHDTFDSPKT